MVSDINIKKPRAGRDNSEGGKTRQIFSPMPPVRRRRQSIVFSRLSRVIFMSNIIGLVILVAGSLVLNQYADELVNARVSNLESQAKIITSILGDTASGYGSSAELDVQQARDVLSRIDLPDDWRIRLFDDAGQVVADSELYVDDITVTPLDDLSEPEPVPGLFERTAGATKQQLDDWGSRLPWRQAYRDEYRWNLSGDVRKALRGDVISGKVFDENEKLVVAVTMPVRRVQKTLGAVVVESRDVADIIAAERRALMPFIGLALLASLLSSLALTMSIAFPLRHLSHAAEQVARSNDKVDVIPDFSARGDEIGELSTVLKDMTAKLYARIDDIANFAADVAHEIKNPLTSLRSASDTLSHAKTKAQRTKLIEIIQNDVSRMDRLISDISNASKVDANLAREKSDILSVREFLTNLVDFYEQTKAVETVNIRYDGPDEAGDPAYIRVYETPFAQVIRNLIDNAATFSPAGGEIVVRHRLEDRDGSDRVIISVEDDGPGIPNDNLETIFERFYTERPKGAQFGSHSGLGLAISRQIVRAHNGRIHAENRIEGGAVKGARFVVNIPQYISKKKKTS